MFGENTHILTYFIMGTNARNSYDSIWQTAIQEAQSYSELTVMTSPDKRLYTCG